DAGLGALRQLGDGIDRLGRIALRVAHDQLDRPAIDAARLVDLVDRKLRAAVDADAGGRTGPRERRQVADLDRVVGGDGRSGETRAQLNGTDRGPGKPLATLDEHKTPPTTPLLLSD